MRSEPLLLLKIGAPHGVKGAVRLISYAEDDGLLRSYSPFSDKNKNPYTLLTLSTIGKGLVGTFKEIPDRNMAEKLTHLELFIKREQLPAIDPDEFYINDVIGMKAMSQDGIHLGEITEVNNYGASDVLTLILLDGSEVLMPLGEPFVQDIDLDKNEMIVILPVEA
jgi:16S rRNA processing protein RimM